MGELAGLLVAQGLGVAAGVGNAASNAQALRGQQSYANSMTDVNSTWSGIQQSQLLQDSSIAGSRARQGYINLASTQRARMAGNGVNVNFGSAAQVQSESRALGDIERLQIQQAAYNQAIGLQAENQAAIGQNRMRQIAVRAGINSSYANAAGQVGQGLVRGAYTYDRYQGLNPAAAAPKSALDMTLDYTPKDLMPPSTPDYGQNSNRSELA